jgi:hypothetical protein
MQFNLLADKHMLSAHSHLRTAPVKTKLLTPASAYRYRLDEKGFERIEEIIELYSAQNKQARPSYISSYRPAQVLQRLKTTRTNASSAFLGQPHL